MVLPEIALHVRSVGAVVFVRMERALNVSNLRALISGFAGLLLPVLHDHGDARGATAVRFLLDERNVQPHSGSGGAGSRNGADRAVKAEQRPHFLKAEY